MGLILDPDAEEYHCWHLFHPCWLSLRFLPRWWLNLESLVSLSDPNWSCVLSSIEKDVKLGKSDEELNPDDDPEGGSYIFWLSYILQCSTKIAFWCYLSDWLRLSWVCWMLAMHSYSGLSPHCCLWFQESFLCWWWFPSACLEDWGLKESNAAAWASKSKLLWLIFMFPNSQGLIPFPFGFEGPSPLVEVDSSLLGHTLSCLHSTIFFWGVVRFFLAIFTALSCSEVWNFLLLLMVLWLCTCLHWILVQGGYSILSGVSISSSGL